MYGVNICVYAYVHYSIFMYVYYFMSVCKYALCMFVRCLSMNAVPDISLCACVCSCVFLFQRLFLP